MANIIHISHSRLLNDLNEIVHTSLPRNAGNVDVLDEVAVTIYSEFEKTSNFVRFQEYYTEEAKFKNVICSFGPADAPRVIVGAHYDVAGNSWGADDNASAVVGLLEIARNLKDVELKCRIDLVAYSTEEPPYFDSELMGSHVHAWSLSNQ